VGQTIKDRSSVASAKVAAATKAAGRAAATEVRHHSPFMLGSAAIVLALGLSWLAQIIFAFHHDPSLPGRERLFTFFGIGTIGWAVAILFAVLLWSLARRRGGADVPAGVDPPGDPVSAPTGQPESAAISAAPSIFVADTAAPVGAEPAATATAVAGFPSAAASPSANGPVRAAARARSLQRILPMALIVSALAVGGSALIDVIVELTNFGNGISAAFTGLIGYLAVLPVAAVAAWWVHAERSTTSDQRSSNDG
jgi:hypothetical protein